MADPDVFVVDDGAFGEQLHRTFEFGELRQRKRKPQAPAGSRHSLCTTLLFIFLPNTNQSKTQAYLVAIFQANMPEAAFRFSTLD